MVEQRRTHSSMVSLLCLVFAATAVDYQALHSSDFDVPDHKVITYLRLEVVGGEASLLVRVRC